MVANGVGGPKRASIMRSMPVRVIGCTVSERYQKSSVRNTTGSVIQDDESDREVMVSVASAVSCAIRMAVILFGQKGFDGWRSSLATKCLPAFRTGVMDLPPLYESSFLEDVTAGCDRGRRLLDGFHRDRTGLFGRLCVFEDGVDDVCWVSETCCRRGLNECRNFCIDYVDLAIIRDILNMAFLYPGTA